MALIALLTDIREKESLARFEGGFQAADHPTYDQPTDVGIRCANPNCIVHDPMERQYTRNRFSLIRSVVTRKHRLRCMYCEGDIDEFAAVSTRKRKLVENDEELSELIAHDREGLLLFADAAEAGRAGHADKPRKRSA
jgi:hypothetical protein